ncbi:DUF2779 domain-containing protein [Campylobacter concisus]|uniref:DUF2779 domain-containing protein n=1 Tax=Campylobacter concisus TaxID=199 RepID=UPI000398E2FA|nr:DUF2779 domain-containing protein [Campylobacter concisus]ERJ27657.1 hypothetical protein ATCC51561_453 [Campylobacter concisus ATCC 51561]
MALSKSLYIRGLQCKKSLWLKKKKPEVLQAPDDGAQAVFDTGTSVGELACELFSGGERIEYTGDFGSQIARTKELMGRGTKIIYEATFCFDGILVMVDILRIGRDGLIINEVKSSTSVKDVYIDDASIQYYVISSLGYKVSVVNIIHIDNSYVRGEKLELEKFFHTEDVTEQVKQKQADIPQILNKFEEILSKNVEPEVDIGPHCSNPYACDAWEYCWLEQRGIPEYSVFDISRLRSDKKFELYKNGIVKFEDIKELDKFNASQQIQIRSELSKEQIIDKGAIKEFLNTLSYPLYHLDFETFQQAVPEFIGLRPYEQIPFQFSIHKDDGNGNLEHFEFLAEAGADPRYELALNLIKFIPQDACVLAYNMSFEKGVIRRLAEIYPQISNELMAIHDNIKDLMAPFANKSYYHPKMQGSYSIKYVLPALVPEFESAYKDLNLIHHGGEAMQAYAAMAYMPAKERDAYKKALLEYCKLDTLAMVKVLEKLREVTK